MTKDEEESIRANERKRWADWIGRLAEKHYSTSSWSLLTGIAECLRKNQMGQRAQTNTEKRIDSALSTPPKKNTGVKDVTEPS